MDNLRILRRIVVALAVTSLTTAACSRNDPDSAVLADSARAAGTDTLPSDYHGELGPGFRFATRDSLIRRLGAPDSVRSEVIPNRHVPGVTDTIFTIFYSELVATVHKPGGGSDIFAGALISSNRYLRTPVIGMAAGDVEKSYGPPDWRSDTSLTYGCVGSCIAVEDPVEFFLARDRVQRVRLSYYVD